MGHTMPAPLHEVVVSLADRRRIRHLLAPGEYVLGRSHDSDIRIDSPEVSLRHARLAIAAGGIQLEDLGSSNGSYIEGRRLAGSIRLGAAGQFRLGTALVEVGPVRDTEDASGSSVESPVEVGAGVLGRLPGRAAGRLTGLGVW